MDKMRFETPDMTEQNIDRIAALFPGCVTEMRGGVDGKVKRGINFEMLKQMLSPDVVDGDECYEFTWVGKRASIVEANKPIRKTLRPCPEESKNWDTTENLYIEGDNLEVLKLLQEAYLGKVKMIYIDPPYNTGNDFIYADDFMRSQEEENEQMGMYDENENRLFKNTDTNGRFHSDWCSMMYSRLHLCKNLLADNGVIFISIDDSEVKNLKNICDEVFGNSNFVAQLIWQNKKGGGNDSTHIAIEHEYILTYAKNISLLGEFYESYSEDYIKRYKEKDDKGRFFWDTFKRKSGKQYYPITCPDGTVLEYDEDGNAISWLRSKSRFDEDVKAGEVRTVKNGDKWSVQFKQRMPLGKTPRSIFTTETVISDQGTTSTGASDVYEYFKKDVFSNPKPVELIKFLLGFGLSDNDIVLDFFSGSGTTAEAVMRSNVEGGAHKYILVQLPESIDSMLNSSSANAKRVAENAATVLDELHRPHLLTELAKERIRRAGKQILELSLKSFEKEGLIEKVSKSKISALSSKNSLGKEGVIEKYAGELSEIRSLEEVYGSGGARVSSHQAAAAGGDLRTGRPNASGGSFHSVEYSGGTVAGNAGVYPVFESGKGITGGVGNTVIALRPLALLNELGYRVCLERFRGDQQNACGTDQTSELQTLNSKLQALNSKLSLDTGFRVLKLDDSNVKDVYYAADEYDQQNLANMISNIKDDRTDLDLLFGCLLDWGVPLSMPYTSEQIEGCTVHTYNDGDLIACFDANIPESVVKEIASRKPLRAVFRDSSFANSPAKINVFEIFKLYMPEDADDISKRVRVI